MSKFVQSFPVVLMNPFLFPFQMKNETNPRGQVTSLPDTRCLPEVVCCSMVSTTWVRLLQPLYHFLLNIFQEQRNPKQWKEQGSLRDAEAHGRTQIWTSRAVRGKWPGFRLESRRPTSCMCDLGPLLCFPTIKSTISNSITCQDD